MSTNFRPSEGRTQPAGTAAVPVIQVLSLALDPTSGHLYLTSDSGPIQLRDIGGRLIPSDDTRLPAARLVRTPERTLIL